jgi:hypothetical protein
MADKAVNSMTGYVVNLQRHLAFTTIFETYIVILKFSDLFYTILYQICLHCYNLNN